MILDNYIEQRLKESKPRASGDDPELGLAEASLVG